MKNKLILLLAILSLSSCGVIHKAAKEEVKKDSIVVNNDINRQLFIDTTNTVNLKIEYKQVVFFDNDKHDVKSVTTYTMRKDSIKKAILKDTIAAVQHKEAVVQQRDISSNISKPSVWAQIKWVVWGIALLIVIIIIFKILKKWKIL
ncbi:MAG: hypothetical protein WCR80_06105 [Bacilli bacterium]